MSTPPVTDISNASCSIPSARRRILIAEDTPFLDQPLEEVSNGDDLSRWSLSAARRAIDLLASIFALLLFAPIMLIVAIIVPLESEGPAIFTQERMGRNGEPFTLYKFRSMKAASHEGSPITVSGDNRITRAGALLRRFKLDELPQFLNVLKGDMSLVGPRPKLPHHEALHMPFRPGITGPATLAFRFEEEMLKRIPADQLDHFYELYVKPRKATLDWEYMQAASFWTDLGIIWKTARACISKKVNIREAHDEFLPELAEIERRYPASGASSSLASVSAQSAHSTAGFSFVPEQAEF